MDIIIIGCGKVGTTLAEQLVREDYNVVMIDTSAERMQRVSDDIDAIKLVGNGASISMQIEAGVQTADMLIAVTGSDEMNLLCCLIAQKANHCQTIGALPHDCACAESDLQQRAYLYQAAAGNFHDYQPGICGGDGDFENSALPVSDQDRSICQGKGRASEI